MSYVSDPCLWCNVRLDEEVVGPLSSPYTTGTQALAQYRLGCKALRSAKLYRNTAAAHNQQVPHATRHTPLFPSGAFCVLESKARL